MTIAFTLLLASTLIGLATSLHFRVWALVLASPLIAVISAVMLQSHGFAFTTGAPLVASCLALSQCAYLAGVLLSPAGGSIAEEIDGIPGGRGQHKISGQNE